MISVFLVNGHLLAQALFTAILFWKTWIFFQFQCPSFDYYLPKNDALDSGKFFFHLYSQDISFSISGLTLSTVTYMNFTPYNHFPLEIDLTEIIPLFHDSMGGPTPDLAALSSQSSFDSSLTSQAFINVGLHNQNPTENTIQIHEPPEAMQTQVSAV